MSLGSWFWILLLPALLLGWDLFQRIWDRRLFYDRSDEDFVRNVRAREADRLFDETPGILALDVRPREGHLAGHIPGSRNTPFVGAVLDSAALEGLAREAPLLVYCDGGYRSRRALQAIQEAGFRRIFHLHRGILSWKHAGLPTEKARST